MNEIAIEYTAELKNYIEAEKYFQKSKKKKYIFDKVMEIVLILTGIFVIISGITLKEPIISNVYGIFFVVIGILFLSGISTKAFSWLYFKLHISKRGVRKLKISDGKIRYEIKDMNSEIGWSYYKNFLETPKTILLLYGKRHYAVVPKKVFQGKDLEYFISLLNQKFPPANKSKGISAQIDV